MQISRQESVDNTTIRKQGVDDLSFDGNTKFIIVLDDSEMPNTLIDNAESINKRIPGRRGRKRAETNAGLSKRMIRDMNKKYIEDVNKKSEYPSTFVYSKLIELVKENFKEFFIDPDDIVLNNNAQINRKKGKKYALSQGAYEYGDGFFRS